MSNQLNLLDWAPPSAAILQFPISRLLDSLWRHRVGTIAFTLAARKTQAGYSNAWHREVASIERKMLARGAQPNEAAAAIDRFRFAVEAELSRIGNPARRA